MDCLHFGVCGGCACTPGSTPPRPPNYAQELGDKETRVRNLLADIVIDEWRPIVPSPQEWHYRNKMEFAFGELREMPFRLGQRETGRFDRIVDLETCHLMSPQIPDILKIAREWAKAQGLSGHNRFSHQGDLRYLVVREGKNTNQRMGMLIVSREVDVSLLAPRFSPFFTTFWMGITDTRSDVARAKDMRLLWGPGTIQERLNDVEYRISPYSFFQTNTRGTEKLYSLLNNWAKSVGGGALLDLYCGSGGISLGMAKGFDRIIGVDINREAIEDAQYNAALNGFGNTEYVTEDALEFMKKLPASKLAVQLTAVIVDPPRAGLTPKALTSLIELNPPRLAYVSCNPESLARDLKLLAPLYHIRSVQPVDLFPHTAHVETVALLEHR